MSCSKEQDIFFVAQICQGNDEVAVQRGNIYGIIKDNVLKGG